MFLLPMCLVQQTQTLCVLGFVRCYRRITPPPPPPTPRILSLMYCVICKIVIWCPLSRHRDSSVPFYFFIAILMVLDGLEKLRSQIELSHPTVSACLSLNSQGPLSLYSRLCWPLADLHTGQPGWHAIP